MARFKPTVRCYVSEHPEGTDRYGQRVYNKSRQAMCSIVKLQGASEKTAVRTDSSATGGSANEIVADAVLLFPVNERIGVGDLIEVAGTKIKVTGVHKRFSVLGRHDHDQVWGDVYGG